MTTQEILTSCSKYYKLNLEYLELEYNGMPVKFRMNKNHGRNHLRNDNDCCHNLSLVSERASGSNQNSYFTNEASCIYVQKQVFGISGFEDASAEILDFLSDIDFENR